MDYDFLSNQLLLIATVVGAMSAVPVVIEFYFERRKRRERVDLSLEDRPLSQLTVHLAGLDGLLAEIEDLLDRAGHPEAYRNLDVGNEVLIIGPSLSGKKTLAMKMGVLAGMARVITVYNPRNADALVRAKQLIQRSRQQKILLLLPRMDLVFQQEDEEVLVELDALIEASSGRSNVLVVGTAVHFEIDGAIDNIFGIKIVLPGTELGPITRRRETPDVAAMLSDVAMFYLSQALQEGFSLSGMTEEDARLEIVRLVSNPAEIEDIVVLCRTSALFEMRRGGAPAPEITPGILQRSIKRVVVNVVKKAA